MKKLFNIMLMVIVLVVSSTITQAQDKSYSFKINKDLGSVSTYAPVSHFVFTDADTVSNYDSTYSVVLTLNQETPVKYDIRHKLIKSTGTPTTTVYLQGRKFSSDDWSAISNVTWSGTTADTTIRFAENSTAKFYRQFRIYHDCDGSVSQNYLIDELEIKLWPSP